MKIEWARMGPRSKRFVWLRKPLRPLCNVTLYALGIGPLHIQWETRFSPRRRARDDSRDGDAEVAKWARGVD